jgi:hypothetical protein
MNGFFYTSATGRIATIMIGVEILLPYLLRGTRLSVALGLVQAYSTAYLQRMWPHYWAGYLLLGLSFVHAWIPMSAGRMPRTSMTGLWLATFALALLFVQLLLGLALQGGDEARRLLRVAHFWTMLAVSALVGAHLYLNSSFFLIRGWRAQSWMFPRSFLL